MDRQKIKGTIVLVGVFIIALAVLGQNLILIRKNRSLLQRLDDINGNTTIPVGRTLRNVDGSGVDGKLRMIPMPEKASDKLLVVTFSTGCPYCQASEPVWTALSKELRERPGWSIRWVSRDAVKDVAEYCHEGHIPADETIADPTYRTYLQLGLKAVPKMIVVGPGGHIEKVWNGRLDTKEKWNEIAAYFNLHQKEPPSGLQLSDLTASVEK